MAATAKPKVGYNGNSVLGLLHHSFVGSVADVSEIYAVSVFSADEGSMYRMMQQPKNRINITTKGCI
jgi:hypothetical protein